uniref:Protein kinase domain-containing protein n=1 Tax=Loa loa TaxID=7209 RepID=A0A1I7VTK1_LOALO
MSIKRKKFGDDWDDIDIDEEDEKHIEELEEQSMEERLQLKKIQEMEKREQERRKREKEKEKQRKSPAKRPKLPIGVLINTDRSRYEVLELLGAGGFGDVYKVRQKDGAGRDDDTFALKTETNTSGKTLNRLKVNPSIIFGDSICEDLQKRLFC